MRFFLILIFFHLAQLNYSQEESYFFYQNITPDSNWKLLKVGDENFKSDIRFPSGIHEALYKNGIISNPYDGNNEETIKWVEETDWIAEQRFMYDDTSDLYRVFINLKGISVYAKVYLNNKLILESNNSFIDYQIDITDHLKFYEANTLKIYFPSLSKKIKELKAKHKITLPGEERVYVRTPQYEFGWDWGPHFINSGVRTEFFLIKIPKDKFKVSKPKITKGKITKEKAELLLDFNLTSPVDQELKFLYGCSGKKIELKRKIKKGTQPIRLILPIKDPKLWWPNGMGDAITYSVYLKIVGSDKLNQYYFQQPYGIFTSELVQEKDSIGQSFYFKINGVPVYMKGFNLIPFDHFGEYSRLKTSWTNYVGDLNRMGCNMVRVWGGGEYLSEEFYADCLMRGILVWQDFMFACAMYPGDEEFISNVKNEINYTAERLSNASNIVLWCGNNENDEGWKNWGWEKQYNYSATDSATIWNNYLKLFHEVIPQELKKTIPEADYITTSPLFGWGRKESMTHGDSHYWGVWWGKEPIEKFNEKVPRFMSEFGMQAMPDLSTLKKVIADSLLNFNSPEFKNHQKHPTGFETLNHYLEKYLVVPKDMFHYSYATQVLQAITLQTAIEAQRRARPKCMGTLIWQLNDTWPVTSWSVIDYYGNWKLGAHTVADLFQPLVISVVESSNAYDMYVVNDKNETIKRELRLSLIDFTGNRNYLKVIPCSLPPNSSKIYYSLPKTDLQKFDLTKNVLICELQDYGVKTNFHFVPFNQLKLEHAGFHFTVEEKEYKKPTRNRYELIDYYEVSISATTYLPFLQLYDSKNIFIQEKNFLDVRSRFPYHLLPGEKIGIKVSKSLFKTKDELVSYLNENLVCLNNLLKFE